MVDRCLINCAPKQETAIEGVVSAFNGVCEERNYVMPADRDEEGGDGETPVNDGEEESDGEETPIMETDVGVEPTVTGEGTPAEETGAAGVHVVGLGVVVGAIGGVVMAAM